MSRIVALWITSFVVALFLGACHTSHKPTSTHDAPITADTAAPRSSVAPATPPSPPYSVKKPAPQTHRLEAHTPTPVTPLQSTSGRFVLHNLYDRNLSVTFENGNVSFSPVAQPLVGVVLFSDRYDACMGMLPYLGDLQQHNADRIFFVGLAVYPRTYGPAFKKECEENGASFFVSSDPEVPRLARLLAQRYTHRDNYPLPSILFFKNGHYKMSLEGAAPYETVQYLIDQLAPKKREEQ